MDSDDDFSCFSENNEVNFLTYNYIKVIFCAILNFRMKNIIQT